MDDGGPVGLVPARRTVHEKQPLDEIPPPCDPQLENCPDANEPKNPNLAFEGMPELEVFDVAASEWRRLPHLTQGQRYSLASAANYVEPSTGTLLVRFVNENTDSVSFNLGVELSGVVG